MENIKLDLQYLNNEEQEKVHTINKIIDVFNKEVDVKVEETKEELKNEMAYLNHDIIVETVIPLLRKYGIKESISYRYENENEQETSKCYKILSSIGFSFSAAVFFNYILSLFHHSNVTIFSTVFITIMLLIFLSSDYVNKEVNRHEKYTEFEKFKKEVTEIIESESFTNRLEEEHKYNSASLETLSLFKKITDKEYMIFMLKNENSSPSYRLIFEYIDNQSKDLKEKIDSCKAQEIYNSL